jgi:3-isopropylmalate dehydrogenase
MKMQYNIAVIGGDGIGPEITASAVETLQKTGGLLGIGFDFFDVDAGGISLDKYGVPLTDENLKRLLTADSVLLGAVGGPKWDTLPGHLRPERALLAIRKEMGLYANYRPVRLFPELKESCLLRADIAERGIDILIVRELTGGIYFGERGRRNGGKSAYDTEEYSEAEIERVGRAGFSAAQKRRKKLCSVDKANVLESSRLWREVMHRISCEYPNVEYSDMLVDNAAMQLIRRPYDFDVIVTSNMFGDILSDEASQLTGSIGLLPSASVGAGKAGLFEPIHGSAPDIAGTGLCNPVATVLSAAMLLEYSLNLPEAARLIENAVSATLKKGLRTRDIAPPNAPYLTCQEITKEILKELR